MATLPDADARLSEERCGAPAGDALRAGVIAIFGGKGVAHVQIGRTYPPERRSDPVAWAVLRALTTALDPHGLMNPGVLGF